MKYGVFEHKPFIRKILPSNIENHMRIRQSRKFTNNSSKNPLERNLISFFTPTIHQGVGSNFEVSPCRDVFLLKRVPASDSGALFCHKSVKNTFSYYDPSYKGSLGQNPHFRKQLLSFPLSKDSIRLPRFILLCSSQTPTYAG